ncbi:MAG TPA: hypothetical protein VEB42_01695 [Chitinophagaceae bacterium]|nr:hypothetical protein [Chitinophagaceae bacterium]
MRKQQQIMAFYISRTLLLAVCWGMACVCYAQTARQQAISELNKLTARYRSSDHLSFNIDYRYALENKPAVFLDSLKGSFKMHGLSYWYAIDSTEAVVGKDYTVMLFKEDRIMYLVKPSSAMPDKNPLSMPDSTWLASDEVKCSIDVLEHEKKITLEFNPGKGCKRIEYYISKRTGMVNRILSYVPAAGLFDPEVRPTVQPSDYGIVEMKFSNYKEKSFDGSILNMATYFRKEGNEFVTSSPYEPYKIFLGNPNL